MMKTSTLFFVALGLVPSLAFADNHQDIPAVSFEPIVSSKESPTVHQDSRTGENSLSEGEERGSAAPPNKKSGEGSASTSVEETALPETGPPVLTPAIDPDNYRLVLGGNIVGGVGAAAFVTMVVGLGIRFHANVKRDLEIAAESSDPSVIEQADDRIRLGTGMAIGGGVACAALFGASIAMIVVGRRREKRRREAFRNGTLEEKPSASLPSLYVSDSEAGVAWQLRF